MALSLEETDKLFRELYLCKHPAKHSGRIIIEGSKRMNLATITKHLPKGAHRAILLAKKFSPEILTGLGIVAGGATVVTACRATAKLPDILDEHENRAEVIDDTLRYGVTEIQVGGNEPVEMAYSEADAKKDRVKNTLTTGLAVARNYAPAIALGATSVTCILGAHGIMGKRNAALTAAYSLVQNQFNDYRNRVKEEFGKDKDYQLLNGLKSDTIDIEVVNPETGRKKKEKKEVVVVDPNGYSQYARCFDPTNQNWIDSAEMNLLFLRNQQNYANDLLHSRGHVFLNEIYDGLGIPRTSEGAVVGWVLSDDGSTDNFIDFGIYSVDNQLAIDFVNGYESSIWLDFNVDGVIYDLI